MSKIDINKSWKYDAAPDSTSHIKLKDKYDLFIGGEFVKPLSKKYFNTLNPASNQSIAKIADANDIFSTNITRSNAPQTCRRCGVRLS